MEFLRRIAEELQTNLIEKFKENLRLITHEKRIQILYGKFYFVLSEIGQFRTFKILLEISLL